MSHQHQHQHQPHQRHFLMGGGGGNNAGNGPNNDTTFTKIFVGGLAWETQRETMKRYFEQFGDILEAVVITDKNTGRSKGYGFVTFKDPDSAMRACQDPSPVIDGRRANCNLASLGAAQRPRQPTPQHGFGRFRSVPSSALPAYHGSMSKATYLNQSTQYPFPYSSYGYPAYSQESMYPMNYYSFYGGHQYSPYYAAAAAAAGATSGMFQSFHSYYSQYASAAHSSSQAQGLGMQFPQMLQYPYLPQQQFNAGILSLPPSAQSTTAGATVAAASSSLQTEPVTTTAENRPT